MDQIIERNLDEQTLKSRFWRIFFVFHAPVYVHCSLYLMLSCVWWMLFPHLWLFWLIIVVFCASYLFTFFSNVWRISRDTFRRQGAFEQQTIVHLTDKYMEISRGENHSKGEYGILFSQYFITKENIVMVVQNAIAGSFPKTEFADGGAEFVQCLEKAGVKRLRLWSWKRWWSVFLVLALVLISVAVELWVRKNSNDDRAKIELVYREKCRNTLSELVEQLLAVSKTQQETLAWWKKVESNGEFACSCPLTEVAYVFVSYPRQLDRNSRTAAYTPLVFESIVGSHHAVNRIPPGISICKDTPLTLVAFEDGHVETLGFLASHQELYERYAPLMSKEDAEVLRKCCEKLARSPSSPSESKPL